MSVDFSYLLRKDDPGATLRDLDDVVALAPVVTDDGDTIPAGTEPAFSTRVKMGGTSNVHVLAKADGKWLIASKEIKVTLGGCGG